MIAINDPVEAANVARKIKTRRENKPCVMESVVLDQEWDETHQICLEFTALRDRSTGRWDLAYIEIVAITIKANGSRVVLPIGLITSEVDAKNITAEFHKPWRWELAEAALEAEYQRQQEGAEWE